MLAFAFHQEYQTLSSDWISFPNHYLLYASSGAFHLDVGQASWFLPPQRAAWILAHTPIRVRIDVPSTCASVLFTPEAIYPPGGPCRVFAVSALAREMIQFAMRWGREREQGDDSADRFFLSLALVCADLAQQADDFWLPRAQTDELAKAMAYGLARLAETPTIDTAATAAGVSERTLARRFAEETAMNWQQFIRRARMIRAIELLCAQETKIIEIAHAVGFKSQSAFIVAFREFTGQSPTDYRRRLQAQP